ncbi:MAG: DUF1697 domain-containing protein [Streptococcus salivarius]
MKRYAFLVRGINVGGRHKVVMEEFCRRVQKELRYVTCFFLYQYSGNLFFEFCLDERENFL